MSSLNDKRLERLVKKALLALEDPSAGFVFDDFDLRYREQEAKRERKSAEWFYRNKLSFDAKYDEDCGGDPCNEPGWVTDNGHGARMIRRGTDFGVAIGRLEKRRRAALAKARRVSPALAKTLRLILRNGANRRESIGTLAAGASWHQAEVRYYRHRAALIALFNA